MVEPSAIPPRLRRLALLWFVTGVLSGLGGVKFALDFGAAPIDVGVLGLVFGPGLVFAWRWVPIAIRWVSWLTIVVVFLVAVNLDFTSWWGWLSAAVLIVVIGLLLEQLYVLKLPEVARYYQVVREADRVGANG